MDLPLWKRPEGNRIEIGRWFPEIMMLRLGRPRYAPMLSGSVGDHQDDRATLRCVVHVMRDPILLVLEGTCSVSHGRCRVCAGIPSAAPLI